MFRFGRTRAALVMAACGSCVVFAQGGQAPAAPPAGGGQGRGNQGPPPPMTFFVTITSLGKGGNL